MATPIDPLHPWWILLAALLLWLLATSVASASGWGEGEGVRYRTYRSGAATPTPTAAPAVEAIHPWVRLGAGEGADVWVEPWLLWAPGWTPFQTLEPMTPPARVEAPPPATTR